MTQEQLQKAKIALRKLDCQKDVKAFKLAEFYRCQRLTLLLRIPFSIIKKHVAVRAYVGENGLLGIEMSQEIPINRYLQRSDSPTFESWLQEFHPEEFKEYKRDKFRFLFGDCKDLKRTDAAQSLYDEFDRYTWYKNEQERQYYFSGLLQDADIPSMSEFDLFGTADGSHSVQEISDFKSELLDMQRKYAEHPDRFFHPAEDTADSPAAVI